MTETCPRNGNGATAGPGRPGQDGLPGISNYEVFINTTAVPANVEANLLAGCPDSAQKIVSATGGWLDNAQHVAIAISQSGLFAQLTSPARPDAATAKLTLICAEVT